MTPGGGQKTLLVVGAGRLQIPAFVAGKRMGMRVVGADRDPNAPGARIADELIVVDTHDVEGIVALARRERVDAVVTLCTDRPVRAVAAAGKALGLTSISPEAAHLATHKGKMREAFEAAGAPSPRFRRARSLGEAEAAAREIGFPVMVKPPATSGSRGVFKAVGPEALAKGFERALRIAENEEALIEEFVDGPEVSVETLSFGGEHVVVAITDKRTTGDPFWVESGHVEPSQLDAETQSEIASATLAGLRALGIDNCASHVEIKVGNKGPRLIEVGARLGGDFITTELVLRSTGVDMVEAIIQIALGIRPDSTPRHSRGAAIRYLQAPSGVVTSILGVEEARRMPGVARLEVDVTLGGAVVVTESSSDRPGFVIAEGATAHEAEQRASSAAERVRILTQAS